MKEINNNNSKFAFTKRNYILLGVGVLFIIVGLFFMQGGVSEDPSEFAVDPYTGTAEMFNFQRITLAPILIILGFIINIFAILYSEKGK